AREKIQRHVQGVFPPLPGVEQRGHRVVIGDEIERLSPVLELDGRLHHPEIISQVQRAGRLDARQNSHGQRVMGTLRVASCGLQISEYPRLQFRGTADFSRTCSGLQRMRRHCPVRLASESLIVNSHLRAFTVAPLFFALAGFGAFLSRLVWASTALRIDRARNRPGLGATPVASMAARRALAWSMSGCSFSSSAIVVESNCSYLRLLSTRRAYPRARVSRSTPALTSGVMNSAAMLR